MNIPLNKTVLIVLAGVAIETFHEVPVSFYHAHQVEEPFAECSVCPAWNTPYLTGSANLSTGFFSISGHNPYLG